MANHLTPLDAAFLELEDGDESSHMHVGWTLVFDPLPGGGTPGTEQVVSLLEERLDLLPHFRLRLNSPRVGRLSWPEWVEDPAFDVANHVRRASLPAPGGDAELLDWLGDFYSHRLDRAHPLWEFTLLDGLEAGPLGTRLQGPSLPCGRAQRRAGDQRDARLRAGAARRLPGAARDASVPAGGRSRDRLAADAAGARRPGGHGRGAPSAPACRDARALARAR